MTCARAAPPRCTSRGLRAYQRVTVHVQGLACMFRGWRACSGVRMRTARHDRHRCAQNADHLAHNTPIFSIFRRGGLHFEHHTAARRGLAVTKRGNCTTRDSDTPAGLVWFCGPGVLRVVGCYWWCCAHWRAYWLGESQPSALWGCSSL